MVFLGEDSYISGYETDALYTNQAKVWKNYVAYNNPSPGTVISLTDNAWESEAIAMAVHSGHIYILGHESGDKGNLVMKVWKDFGALNSGATLTLTDDSVDTVASSITFIGDVMYVTGTEEKEVAGDWVSSIKVWKCTDFTPTGITVYAMNNGVSAIDTCATE